MSSTPTDRLTDLLGRIAHDIIYFHGSTVPYPNPDRDALPGEWNWQPYAATLHYREAVDIYKDHPDLPPPPRPDGNSEVSLVALAAWCETAKSAGEAEPEDDLSVFRPASEFLDNDHFLTYPHLHAAIKRYGVKTRKPSKNRLLVHAGEMMEVKKKLDADREAACDSTAITRAVESRKAEARKVKENRGR